MLLLQLMLDLNTSTYALNFTTCDSQELRRIIRILVVELCGITCFPILLICHATCATSSKER